MGSRFCCLFTLILALGFACGAQVLSLGKVQDPGARQLQQKYIAQLQQVATDFSAVHFPYPFYFSQTLDIDEARQKQLPQGSLHFERFNGRMVLEVTGNYYASYSAAVLTPNQRARKTFQDVVLPLLKTASARMDRTVPFDAYAFEIAHHVRSKVLKVDTEGPENLTVILPRAMAEKIVNAKDVEGQQSALLESGVYLNSEPLTLWLTGDDAPADVKEHYRARFTPDSSPKAPQAAESSDPGTLVNPNLVPDSELETRIRAYAKTPHEVSPEQLAKLNTAYQPTVQKLTDDLKAQAHFVDYAPPVFIAFKDGAYLQLTMTTELDLPQGSSQYRIAALAFENHIAHLLRPVSKYFHDKPQSDGFDGVDFSTTAKQPGQPGTESVEFVVPLGALLAYEKYDLTGQELINRSIVLINGERVSLDLQRAESDSSATLH